MKPHTKKPRQPIADKILGRIQKELKKNTVDLAAVRIGRKQAANLQETVVTQEDLVALPKSLAAYMWVQNQLSVMVEQLLAFNALHRHHEILLYSQELYTPEGPPESPLTATYYSGWSMFDIGIGIGRESLGSIAIAVNKKLGAHDVFVKLAQNMVDSRCGIYRILYTDGDLIYLKEVWTETELTARNASGYNGKKGELWYARILPPNDMEPGVHVVFNTPYIMHQTSINAWLQYFERTLSSTSDSQRADEFQQHMKYGPEPYYWPEYVFYSYFNHTPSFIWAKGLPDIAESLPHKDQYQRTRTW